MHATRSITTSVALDGARQLLNLVLAPALVIFSLWPMAAPAEAQAGQAAGFVPIVTPASFTFLISFLIYLGSLTYAVYQALPHNRCSPLLRRCGWYTAIAYLASIFWIIAARAQNLGLTVLFILWILAATIGAYIPTIDRNAVHTVRERWFVRAHISILLGWVAVLTVANIAAALAAAGVTDLLIPTEVWAMVLLALEAAIAVFVIWVSRGDGIFTLTAIWCFAGIVVANIWREPNPVVALTAGLAAVIVAVAWMIRTSSPDAIKPGAPPQLAPPS